MCLWPVRERSAGFGPRALLRRARVWLGRSLRARSAEHFTPRPDAHRYQAARRRESVSASAASASAVTPDGTCVVPEVGAVRQPQLPPPERPSFSAPRASSLASAITFASARASLRASERTSARDDAEVAAVGLARQPLGGLPVDGDGVRVRDGLGTDPSRHRAQRAREGFEGFQLRAFLRAEGAAPFGAECS